MAKGQGDPAAAWWELRAEIPIHSRGLQSLRSRPDASEQPAGTWIQVYNVCAGVCGHVRDSAAHLQMGYAHQQAEICLPSFLSRYPPPGFGFADIAGYCRLA